MGSRRSDTSESITARLATGGYVGHMKSGSGPALVAVDEDPVVLEEVERELRDRYDGHYRVMCWPSGKEALKGLEELVDSCDEVALVPAGHLGSGMTARA